MNTESLQKTLTAYLICFPPDIFVHFHNALLNLLIYRKKDKERHGIGMMSVKDTVKKYHGDLHFEYIEENHIFTTVAMFQKR